MALLDSELDRIRFETGWNLLTVGAEPYIGIAAIFDRVIQPNMRAGAVTSSSTGVTSTSFGSPLTITLADGTGFNTGARIVVDVDDRQETLTAQLVSGTALTAVFSKPHSGTYQVTVEGGESIVRECLKAIRDVRAQMANTFGEGTLKKVDEVEFYQNGKASLFGNLGDQLMFWRDELCSALGIANMWKRRRSAGASLSLY